MPDPFGIEDFSNLTRELRWIFQIIEHRDRGHDFGAPAGDGAEVLGGKEIRNELDMIGIVAAELLARRIDADPGQSFDVVGLERGAVVRADVEHDIATLEIGSTL